MSCGHVDLGFPHLVPLLLGLVMCWLCAYHFKLHPFFFFGGGGLHWLSIFVCRCVRLRLNLECSVTPLSHCSHTHPSTHTSSTHHLYTHTHFQTAMRSFRQRVNTMSISTPTWTLSTGVLIRTAARRSLCLSVLTSTARCLTTPASRRLEVSQV